MEFFLIVSFILVLATIILGGVENEVRETKALDRAALAKTAVASVSHAANSVALQGNGSIVKREVFVPPETICFLYNSTSAVLYCDTGKNIVPGPALLSQPNVSSPCFYSGWMVAVVKNDGGVSVNCTLLG